MPAPDAAAAGVVRVASWEAGGLRESQGLAGVEEALARPGARLWIDLARPDPAEVAAVGRLLDLHPLLVEDIVERNQRAKIELVGEVLHLVLFSLGMDGDRLYDRELDFVLADRFLLTSHGSHWDPRATHHLRLGPGDLLAEGADHLLWALADDIVDSYFPVLDRLGDEIDELEDRVVADARPATLERVFDLKRELIDVRRVTAPEREIFNQLTNRELGMVGQAEVLYFRDVYDHLIRLTDELDNYRELVSGTLDVYLSTVNNNLSVIMKRLTGVTVIVSGVGAIGGLFGMSEAGAAIAGNELPGFWIVILGTLAVAATVAAVLHRIDWI
ncbi:MAG TPA: CorA family divalent cation transporter [Candidatus Limnocylindrales bacterium]